jgi:cytoskeleton protein RodZ
MTSGVTPEASAGSSAADTPGSMLQTARVARSWSVQQAAEQLHLDPWMIEAMEGNRFLALGAPVYARGHLRKYASVLGLLPDTLIARYDVLTQRPEEPTPKPTITIETHRRLSIPTSAVIGAAVVVAVAIGLMWWRGHSASVPAAVTQEAAERAIVKPADTQPVKPETSPVPMSSGSAASATNTQPEAAASAPEPAAASSPPVRMRLTFNEPSWVEIEDARGKRLFFAMGEPGAPRTISGEAPIKVMFGYASAVTLRINERAVSVPVRAGVDSARFVVEADGTIR